VKSTVEELRYDIKVLKEKERNREEKERIREEKERKREEEERKREVILVEWEIRTRIAQALNDLHLQNVPENVLLKLKNDRFGFLPASLSCWASYSKEQFPSINNLSDDDYALLRTKGAVIYNRGLALEMDKAWNAIPADSRALIINMWVARPESRRDIVHITPTAEEAEWLVDNDTNLTAQQINLAKKVIRTSPLFSHIHV